MPEEGWPDEWFADGAFRQRPLYRRPRARLWSALHGHPDSGTYWETHCDKSLKQGGFVAIESVPSTYFHPRLKLLLTVYVDDFKMAGPKENLAKGWEIVSQRLQMDPPTPMGQYLGCMRRPFGLEVDGFAVRGVEYDMEDYLRSKIDQYLDLVEKTTGQRPRITFAATPFFPESPMHNRADFFNLESDMSSLQTYLCQGQPDDVRKILCSGQNQFQS